MGPMTPRRGLPRGTSMRRLATYGQEATFTTTTTTVDTTTDWDDETTTTETATAPVLVKQRNQPDWVADERTAEVVEDAVVYVHEDDLGSTFTIGEAGDGPTTKVTVGSTVYLVVRDNHRSDGTHELQVERD